MSETVPASRVAVRKTYKLYIGGAFPRSESGRSYAVTDHKDNFLANAAMASRKDARDAVTAARKAVAGWSGATAYNRGQVLYRVAELLGKTGHRVNTIHGNKSQNARQHALEGFRTGRSRILVATDIASRGIDIDDVSHVINLDIPDVAENYVHRIGRTARAGSGGTAISFCDPSERESLRAVERLVKRPLAVAGGERRPPVFAQIVEPKAAPKPARSAERPRSRKRFRNRRNSPRAA